MFWIKVWEGLNCIFIISVASSSNQFQTKFLLQWSRYLATFMISSTKCTNCTSVFHVSFFDLGRPQDLD